jgi:hypothetical protein
MVGMRKRQSLSPVDPMVQIDKYFDYRTSIFFHQGLNLVDAHVKSLT